MEQEQKEEWRPVVDYEGLYEVSSLGRVRNVKTGYLLNTYRQKKSAVAYIASISLTKTAGRGAKNFTVGYLVAKAFLPLQDYTGMRICHLDGDPDNNHVENLQWMTIKELMNSPGVKARRMCPVRIPSHVVPEVVDPAPEGETGWRDIPETDGLYELSNIGRVRNKKTNRILKARTVTCGYGSSDYYTLFVNGRALDKSKRGLLTVVFGDQQDKPVKGTTDYLFETDTTKQRQVMCLETGCVYPHPKAAADDCGVPEETIRWSCAQSTERPIKYKKEGKHATFHFRWYKPEELPLVREWRPIKDYGGRYEGRYEVSNYGEIRSVRTVRLRKLHEGRKTAFGRHINVSLYDAAGTLRTHTVATFVATAFLPKPYGRCAVWHMDGNAANNRVDNLYWGSRNEHRTNPIFREKIHQYTRDVFKRQQEQRGTPVVCEETGEVYSSIHAAARATGTYHNTITRQIIRGDSTRYKANRHYKGKPVYHFRYANQEQPKE